MKNIANHEGQDKLEENKKNQNVKILNDNNVSGYFIRCCFVWCGALVGSVGGVSVLCSAVSMA